jgi:hypothetical protein
MRKLFFTLLLILAGYVAYNYYFGEGEARDQAAAVVEETRALSRAVGDLLRHQKERYEAGEFDRTLDRVSDMLDRMKANPGINEGEEDIRQIGRDLHRIDTTQLTPDQRRKLEDVLREIDGQVQ